MSADIDLIIERISNFSSNTINDILKIEESTSIGRPNDITLKEMHLIEAVAKAMKYGSTARALDIATALRIAPGTLTAAVNQLEKKGYLIKSRDELDRRSVCISLTAAGEVAREQHQAFHKELAEEITSTIGTEDARSIIRSMEIAHTFYLKKEAALKKGMVKILADSTCDINLEGAAQLNATILPMSISFGDKLYRQYVDLSSSDFYKLLAESKALPVTSQLTPFTLEQSYREATSGGDEVVAIHLSSALSGTYQSAVLAAREVPGVYAVDSRSATIGSALLVRIASNLRDTGMEAAEIARRLAILGERVIVIAYIPTLKYLVRGGRLSVTAGIIGSMLNTYPLISVRDGVVKNEGKVRGKKLACLEIARRVKAEGIDEEYGVVFGHAAAPEDMEKLKDTLADIVANCESSDYEIGAVIGTHTGPGAVGIAFIKRLETSIANV